MERIKLFDFAISYFNDLIVWWLEVKLNLDRH